MNKKYYKGFDRNMQCRGFRFREGETYHEDSAGLCNSGFDACEAPIDVLNYYAPGDGSIYREVELAELCDKKSDDTKVCGKKSDDTKVCGKTIRIGAEIGIPGLVKAQIEWVKEQIGFDKAIEKADKSPDEHATGYQGAASATGYQGAASATGYRGAASATGNRGAASATGYQGAASATGDRGAASATGNRGAASATGNRGAASATGDRGAASATGYQGAASATGDQGAASATGYQGAASATGYQGAASATGKACAAMTSGIDGKVMGYVGCAIFAVERGEWNGETYPIISVASAIVDGERIKANTWYRCKDGKFVEVQDD